MRVRMYPKVAALIIVSAIAGIAAAVLYFPARVGAPPTRHVEVAVPAPLRPAPPADVPEMPLPATTLPARATWRPGAVSATFDAPVELARRPVAPAEAPAPVPPQPLRLAGGAPLVPAGAPLVPAVAGAIPHGSDRSTGWPRPMHVAGQSIGAAFSTAGRSIAGAFRWAF